MTKILITGSVGFIGMHMTIKMLENGHDVVGIDNFSDYYDVKLKENRLENIFNVSKKNTNGNFLFYKNDLNDNIWDKIGNEKVNSVIHLAAQPGVRYSLINPTAYLKSNVLGFQKVLDFCNKYHINKFLYASSSSVYGKFSKQPFNEEESCNMPESYYAATKKMNELMAHSYFKTHKLSSIGLRFFTVYGPWGRPDMSPIIFTKSAYNNLPINIFNYGKQKRDFTYIDDIINGIFEIFNYNFKYPINEIFNIGNGSPVNLMDFVKVIEIETGKYLKKNMVKAQAGDVEITFADTTKINKLTNYKPKTNITAGVKKFVNWYKTYYKVNK